MENREKKILEGGRVGEKGKENEEALVDRLKTEKEDREGRYE